MEAEKGEIEFSLFRPLFSFASPSTAIRYLLNSTMCKRSEPVGWGLKLTKSFLAASSGSE